MAKLYKIQAYIVDYNDEFCNPSYLKNCLICYTQKHLDLNHIKIDEADIGEWDDDHPLNHIDCPKEEFEKYFKEN